MEFTRSCDFNVTSTPKSGVCVCVCVCVCVRVRVCVCLCMFFRLYTVILFSPSGNASSDSVIRHYAALHRNIVTLRSDDDVIALLQETKPASGAAASQDAFMANAATQIMLASYR